ncbi:hypothetical protein ACIQ9Q_09510 [Streptomyces sp. NPDC094438]|uniref:hypothetical protein n=1 Tax=Streptomyces sp. NPDC094438 TaxID=3366061 RepID=UPI003825FF67
MLDASQLSSMLQMLTPDHLVSMLGIPMHVAEAVVAILRNPGDLMSKVPQLLAVEGLDVGGVMGKIGNLATLG